MQPVNAVVPFLSLRDLLLGSLAITHSVGVLGSPGPETLIADIRNSYATPMTTSVTAYFLAEGKTGQVSLVMRKPSF